MDKRSKRLLVDYVSLVMLWLKTGLKLDYEADLEYLVELIVDREIKDRAKLQVTK